jgi:glycolate oxidase FAD binding subunit
MSRDASVISENLARVLGSGQILTSADELRGYLIGGRTPQAAIRPGSDQEVAEIVRFAQSENLTLVPTGARTKRDMHIPMKEFDAALDMVRLDRVVAYDPADLTLSVEAGLRLSRLASVLAEHGQFLPLAPPFADRATVGGTIASGVDSPLRQFYGTARDYVLGMEFVTGDGRVVKSGGRVVKNVSGYDLHKLMIGSFGSLGVITKVNFRTFPVVSSMRAFLALFDSAQDAVEMRHRIARSPLRPLTLEILSPQAGELCWGDLARTALGAKRSGALSQGRWALLVCFAAAGRILGRYERDLPLLARPGQAALLEENTTSIALARVQEFLPIALESSPAAVILRISVLPSEIAGALDDGALAAAREEIPWAAMARGVGVIYFALLPTALGGQPRSRVDRAVDTLFQAFPSRRGSVAIAWRAEPGSESMPPRKTSRNDLEQMRKIKHTFDPSRVFAPDPLAAWT